MTYIALGLLAAFIGTWVCNSGNARCDVSEYGTVAYRAGSRRLTAGTGIRLLGVLLIVLGVINWLSY